MKKRKKLGQNFLLDEDVADCIIDAVSPLREEAVLEIGPGTGILTDRLAASGCNLAALEIDPILCDRLEEKFFGKVNFKMIRGDAIKYDYALLESKTKIVSNLPYYAATHILKRLIQYGPKMGQMVVMLQKEVADRLVAKPGQREYSSLTVFVQYHCQVERLIEVGKECFSPTPKIDSSVVRLTPLEKPAVSVKDPKEFFKIVHAAFLHKRKMLKNNLNFWSNHFKREHDKTILAGINMNRRGETLSLKEFAVLANYIYN